MNHIAIFIEQLRDGGAERVASLWAHGFAQKGFQVTIVTDLSKKIDYKIDGRVKLYDLHKYGYIFDKKHLLRNVLNLRKVIKDVKPDVIITVLYPLDLLSLLATINMSIPIVNTMHNSFERPKGGEYSLQARFVRFYVNRFFSHVTVLTEADKKYIGKRIKNISVLPNPLTFEPKRDIPAKEKFILAAGRLDVWYCKGFDILLKAWVRLQASYPEWKLKIAGGGDSTPLKKICSDLGIENRVDFLGFVDIKEQYENAEIFVLSSRYDGFGMVLIEAMSQGCACIACDYKGRQREIIADDHQGIICSPEDIEGVSKAIQNLIENDNYRKYLQKNAIDRSHAFRLPNIMQKWDEIFEKIGLKRN